jgi:ribosomal protein L37AE/L43A
MKPLCVSCGDTFSAKRRKLGYLLCLDCGEQKAKQRRFTVAPMNKSNYMLFTDSAMLKQLNPKVTH